MGSKLSFAGHESFTCKQFWLKKGVDFVLAGKNFNDDTAVADLGVGKNMVRSIRHWLDAFGITDNDQLSELGEYLFGEGGKDPYLEDIGTIWLLHYQLVKLERASIYNLVYNDFRKTRTEFRKEQLHQFIKVRCEEISSSAYNPNTVERDIKVFLSSYLRPTRKRADIEDNFTGLLHEISLLEEKVKDDIIRNQKTIYYSLEGDFRDSVPYHIVLFALLDNPQFSASISFRDMQVAENSPGTVFALSGEGLYQKLDGMVKDEFLADKLIYSETAGNRVLQVTDSSLDKWKVLDDYYQY